MNINVQELKTRLDNGEEIHLIDVREAYENEEYNIGGLLIPIGELPNHIPELEIDKNAEIVLYCRSGNRSGMGQFLMKEAGFQNVYNLIGGMIDWQEAFENQE